ncbi:MAG TPA: glycosyltransferase [Gemmatimonadaceae bacterium]|nr:glycosyltransferase [Gemmatimonadaceae bacterium]
MIRISVVIPTCNRVDLLERCVAAITRQTLSPDEYELVVVDDGSSAATSALIRKWQAHSRIAIRYVAIENGPRGPAAARNVGWHVGRAPIIAFTDDDTIPAPDWLEQAIAGFRDVSVDAAWGRIVVPLPSTPTDYERDTAGLETAGFVTANCFVRRSVLERLGGFDEAFRSAWREDSDLYFRLLRGGQRVRYLPNAAVEHPVRRAPWGVSVLQQRKASYDALLYRKHPELFRQYVTPARPWQYYPIVLALTGMGVGAALGRRTLTEVAGAAWLVLTLRFAMQRLRATSRAPTHVAEMLATSAVIPPLSILHRTRGAIRHGVLFW